MCFANLHIKDELSPVPLLYGMAMYQLKKERAYAVRQSPKSNGKKGYSTGSDLTLSWNRNKVLEFPDFSARGPRKVVTLQRRMFLTSEHHCPFAHMLSPPFDFAQGCELVEQ
jgi:hypothetical protein